MGGPAPDDRWGLEVHPRGGVRWPWQGKRGFDVQMRVGMDEQATKAYDRIVVDPSIMVGKPVVAGTRIPVAVVLRHLALNLDLQDLFAAYPRLTEPDVQACLRYAADLLEGEETVPAFVPRSRVARTLR